MKRIRCRRTWMLRLGRALGCTLPLAMAACQEMGATQSTMYAQTPQAKPNAPAPVVAPVALLLPLTGPNAGLGQQMLNAARLALDFPGAPKLDPRDTGGSPSGAAGAARAAIAAGDRLVLGPLTAPDTGSAAIITTAAHVPMLAFTSDSAQSRPGVWTMGLTAEQQMQRLVMAVQGEGKSHLAALLPDSPFGRVLGAAYTRAVAQAAMTPPQVKYYAAGDVAAMKAGLQALMGPLPAAGVPPIPPFDTLLLAETGDRLQQLLPQLATDGVGLPQVRVLGTALWASEASRIGNLAGAWFAAPDPAQRAAFEQRYRARYGAPPPTLASLAYDAGSLARVLAPEDYNVAAMTRPEGFTGADGVLAFLPDGHVQRGLALFEIEHGGTQIVSPAPRSLVPSGN